MEDRFAERMKEAMNIRGISQAELCRMTKMGRSSMSQYLAKTHKPNRNRLSLIAKALGVSELWLLGHNVPMERIVDKIAERIKEAMDVRGISQADLCRMTKMGRSSMSQYLAKTHKPNRNRLSLIAKALDVSELWLLGHNVPMNDEPILLDMFKRLDSKDKTKICEHLKSMLSQDKYKKDKESEVT
jgi:transcriptional regulator with XRE-family HTH domain